MDRVPLKKAPVMEADEMVTKTITPGVKVSVPAPLTAEKAVAKATVSRPVGSMSKERSEKLSKALAQLEKSHGKGIVMRLGDGDLIQAETLSTGFIGLDQAVGLGGIAKGRIAEIFGPEGCGKTTLALSIIAQSQKRGGIAAFIDAEHALDLSYAERLGVDVSNLLLTQPDSGEQALEVAQVLIESGAADVVVIDSVASLVPQSELNGTIGDANMATQARMMSQGLRMLTGVVKRANAILIFINQTRIKIGVMFGDPNTTSGGNALKFYASYRMSIANKEAIKQGSSDNAEKIGKWIRVKVIKNKLRPPFKECDLPIVYGEGFVREREVFRLAKEAKIIEQTGSWYAFGGERIGQGEENVITFLKANPDMLQKITDAMTETITEGEKLK
jgi:recombination protein RecA